MNWGNFFEIGLKVVVAVGAGLAVFMGVSGATKKRETVVEGGNPSLDGSVNDKNTEGAIVTGLRAAQNTCGKLFNLAQGLVAVAEGVSAFTGNGNNNYNFPGYGGYGYFQQPVCGSGWRRINPFIIESIPQGQAPINYNTQYPY